MCMGGKPKTPELPPAAPPPAPVDTTDANSPEAVKAKADEQKRMKLAKGRDDTILTGPLGVVGDAAVQKKTLLGQ